MEHEKALQSIQSRHPRMYNFMFKPISQQKWSRLYLVGGRSSGKSYAVAQAIIFWVLGTEKKDGRFTVGCYRQVQKTIKESIKPALEWIIAENSLNSYFDIKKDEIVCKHNQVLFRFNGLANHIVGGSKSSWRVKIAIVEESQQVTDRSFDILEPTINRNPNFKFIYLFNPDVSTTPIHKRMLGRKSVDSDIKIVNVNYRLNPFLPERTLRDIELEKKMDYKKWLHVYMGHFATQEENAIFNRENIDKNRVDNYPKQMKLLVIGVDPAKGSKKSAEVGDEWGIILCGIDDNNIAYVLSDKSGRYSPKKASQVIANLYEMWEASMIVAEDNVGGEMLRDVIRLANNNLPVKLVTAINSKRHRANPIAFHYEKNEVKHLGIHNMLEYQMSVWTEDSKGSPDRMDAMVHAMRYLFKITADDDVPYGYL